MIPATSPTVAPMRRPLRTAGPGELARIGAGVEAAGPTGPIWWDLAAAAAALSYSPRQVRRLCATAKLPYSRCGRALRFEPHLVRRWAEGQRVGGVR